MPETIKVKLPERCLRFWKLIVKMVLECPVLKLQILGMNLEQLQKVYLDIDNYKSCLWPHYTVCTVRRRSLHNWNCRKHVLNFKSGFQDGLTFYSFKLASAKRLKLLFYTGVQNVISFLKFISFYARKYFGKRPLKDATN